MGVILVVTVSGVGVFRSNQDHSIPGVKFQPKKKGLFLVNFFGGQILDP